VRFRTKSGSDGSAGLAREELIGVLASPNFDADSVHVLLARLKAVGLVGGDAELDLTDEGNALHTRLRESIARPTIELLTRLAATGVPDNACPA
jgi:hypothetical protein